jgi:hypothetical protein
MIYRRVLYRELWSMKANLLSILFLVAPYLVFHSFSDIKPAALRGAILFEEMEPPSPPPPSGQFVDILPLVA